MFDQKISYRKWLKGTNSKVEIKVNNEDKINIYLKEK